jgi:CBS domain-containing protein
MYLYILLRNARCEINRAYRSRTNPTGVRVRFTVVQATCTVSITGGYGFVSGRLDMESIKATDIMIPLDHYPHVPFWFTIRQAVAELERVQLSTDNRQSLPRVVLVFDEEYRMMGSVRRRDLLRGLGANALQEQLERDGENDPSFRRDVATSELSSSHTVDSIRERSGRQVSEIMQPIRVTVDADSTISEVMNVLVVNNVSFAPVVGAEGVVGVVRTAEVLHRLAPFLE